MITRSHATIRHAVVFAWLLLALGLASRCQSQVQPGSSTEPDYTSNGPTSRYLVDNLPWQPPMDYAANLGTGVTNGQIQRVLWDLSGSSGYDSAVDGVAGNAAPFTLAEVSTGLMAGKRRISFELRQDSKLFKAYNVGQSIQQYEALAAQAHGVVNRATSWTALLTGGYGSENAFSNGSLSSSALTTSLPDVGTNSVGLPIGNTLSVHGLASLEHFTSARRSIQVDMGGYYHNFFGLGSWSDQENAGVSLRRYFTARTSVGARVSAVRDAYPGSQCTTASGTLFASARINQSGQLDLSAGPVLGVSGCSGSYQYNALISVVRGRSTLVYVGSARTPSSGEQNGSNWESSSFAGFTSGTPRRLKSRFDGGYARYTLAQTSPTLSGLQGFYLSTELTHQLSPLCLLSFTARYLSSKATGLDINRTTAFLTFHFSRGQRPTHIDNLRDPNDIH